MRIINVLPRLLIIFLLSTFLNTLFAAEKVLCLVTSDLDKEVGKMVYELDEEARVIKHLYRERYIDNKLIERVEMYPKDLLGDGVILSKRDKHIAVRLYSYNFDESSGGVLYLDTLYSGVSGQRKEYPIEVRIENNNNALITYNQVPFNRMHFIAKRSPILGPIGIEKVNFMK